MKSSHLPGFLLILVLFSACRFHTRQRVSGNNNVATETRNPGNFSEIKVTGSMEVYVTQAPGEPSVTIEAEENIIPYIETSISGEALRIGQRNNVSITTHEDVRVHVRLPELNAVALMGSGEIKSKAVLQMDKIRLALNGTGKIDLMLDAPEVEVSSNGSGEVELEGTTRDLVINIAGSGSVDASDLKAENVKVSTAGSGDASVFASMNLDVRIVGSGDVEYLGAPGITSKITGSGTVRRK